MAGVDDPAERLSTAWVARLSGYSVQQIRDLEGLGVISEASRAANGYRRFSGVHVRDLGAYRHLAFAVGPVQARRAMRAVRSLPPDRAAALVAAFHTTLNRERDGALAAQEALRMIGAEAATDAEPVPEDSMTITELATALGVPASTLRFWEREKLLAPERISTRAGSARRYQPGVVREARIIAALRAAGYGIPQVRQTLTAVREWRDLDDPLDALASRVETLMQRTLALLRAGVVLADIIDSGARA